MFKTLKAKLSGHTPSLKGFFKFSGHSEELHAGAMEDTFSDALRELVKPRVIAAYLLLLMLSFGAVAVLLK